MFGEYELEVTRQFGEYEIFLMSNPAIYISMKEQLWFNCKRPLENSMTQC